MKVVSVNRARCERVAIDGRSVLTGIHKRACTGPVAVGTLGLDGDEQADPSVHGGPSKAVYAYPVEHYGFWQTVRAQVGVADWHHALPHGAIGENLTLQGLAEDQLWIGDRLRLPGCMLVVSEPRFPCFKFAHAMGFAQAPKMMAQSGYCGAYLAVLQSGHVAAGDDVELLPGPREVGLRELFMSRASPRRR
jgi:MOSC domain-containing protein YiiM